MRLGDGAVPELWEPIVFLYEIYVELVPTKCWET